MSIVRIVASVGIVVWRALALAPVLVCGLAGVEALAQTYPSRVIHIQTGGTGAVGDLVSRLVAPRLTDRLGQQVVVENRPSGAVLGGIVAKAAPDGHTLLITGNSFWLLPNFQKDVAWDPLRDFLPVSLLTASPSVLVVHPSVPVSNVRELIAHARARPGKLHWGSGPQGTANHLAGEQFRLATKLDIVRVPYKGVGQALNDMVGGQFEMMFPVAGAMAPHLKAGRLRALAVSSAGPSALVPDLPTVAESGGLPGFESISIVGLFVPARTPGAIAGRLLGEIRPLLALPEIRGRLMGAGVEPVGAPAEQLMAVVRSDIELVNRLQAQGGMQGE